MFLEGCVQSFGLKDSDLFDPLSLFDLTNFHGVLCTLSKLSLTPKAVKSVYEYVYIIDLTVEYLIQFNGMKN